MLGKEMGEWNPSLSCHTLQRLLWQLGFDETFLPSALTYLGWSLLEKDHWKQFLRVQTSKPTFMQSKTNPSTACGTQTRKSAGMPKSKFIFKFRHILMANYWHYTLLNKGDHSLLSSSSLRSWILCSASKELKNRCPPHLRLEKADSL